MVSNVRHHRVFIRAGFHSILLQKTFGHSLHIRLGEFDGRLGFGDVALEISGQAREFFAHPLNFGALRLGQFQAGAPIIAHRLGKQLLIFSLEERLGVGVSFDGAVDILPIIDSHHPFLEDFDSIDRRLPDGCIGAGFLHQFQPVGGHVGLVGEIVQSANGVVEGNSRGIDFADAIQRGVGLSDGI